MALLCRMARRSCAAARGRRRRAASCTRPAARTRRPRCGRAEFVDTLGRGSGVAAAPPGPPRGRRGRRRRRGHEGSRSGRQRPCELRSAAPRRGCERREATRPAAGRRPVPHPPPRAAPVELRSGSPDDPAPRVSRRRPTSRPSPIQILAILSGVAITVWVILTIVIIRYRRRPEAAGQADARQPDDRDHLDGHPRSHRRRALLPHHPHDRSARHPGEHARALRGDGPPVVVGVRVRRRHLQDGQRDPPARSNRRCRPTCCRPTSSTATGCRRWAARST